MNEVDVAVVGAGPAGVAAALAAHRAGARTLLIDEQAAIGGHLRWSVATVSGGTELDGLPGLRAAERLAEQVEAAGVATRLGTIAWGLFEGPVLGLAGGNGAEELAARAVVVATGSTDIVAPFPGSTLPGVMTGRAVEIFLHLHRVLPGRRFVVLGQGEDAERVARAIELAGAEVVARASEPAALRVLGGEVVEQVVVGGQTLAVDAVALALGRQPDAELAQQAQAQVIFSPAAGGWVPRRGERLETSIEGVAVAGDAGGIMDVAEALAEGELAGLAAAGAGDDTIAAAQRRLDGLRGPERLAQIAGLRLERAAR